MREWSIESWKPSITKVIRKMQSTLQPYELHSNKNEIHYANLEFLLNGLNRFPTRFQLHDLTCQIKFSESHLTGEVNDTVDIEDFCQIVENWSNWLYKAIPIQQTTDQDLSIPDQIEKLVPKNFEYLDLERVLRFYASVSYES